MTKAAGKKTRAKTHKRVGGSVVSGEPIATLGNGIFVVRTKSRATRSVPKSSDRADTLVGKIGRALSKPGLSRRAVFGDTPSSRVYSYYVSDAKSSKIVRESASGKVTVGRVIGGKFRAD